MIFLLIGLVILWLVTRGQNLDQIWFYLKNANFLWFIPAVAAGILSHFVRALRWKILINSLGSRVKTHDVFYAVMAGYSVNLAVPRLGELTKCVAITKYYGIPLNRVAGTMVAERIVDVLTLIFLLVFTIAIQWHFVMGFLQELFFNRIFAFVAEHPFVLLLLTLTLILAPVLLLIWAKRKLSDSKPGSFAFGIKSQIKGFKEGVESIFLMREKTQFIILSFLIWFLYFLTAYLGFMAIDATRHLTPMAGITLLAMGSLGILAPVPAGIGTYHFITIATLTLLYGVSSEPATSYAYLSHIMQVFLILATTGAIWVFRFVRTGQRLRQKVQDNAAGDFSG